MSERKRSFTDVLTEKVMQLAEPLSAFAENTIIASIQEGMSSTISITIIGGIFLLLNVFSRPMNGASTAVLQFLAPLNGKLMVVNQLTTGLFCIYISAAIGMAYAKRLGDIPLNQAVILSLASFFIITTRGSFNAFDAEGNALGTSILVGNLSSNGIFVSILSSLFAIRVFKFFKEKNIVIKMPDGVPPAISNSFTALIPTTVIFTIFWLIRTVMNFDICTWMAGVLTPLFKAADNVGVWTFKETLTNLLWWCGLHGGSMVAPAFSVMQDTFIIENQTAGAAGLAIPHVWHMALSRNYQYPACIWPICILMLLSKKKKYKALGVAVAPSLFFTIIEPLLFGLPIAFNAFLVIPWLLTTALGAAIPYLACQFGLIGRYFVNVPVLLPPPFSAYLATGGDWRNVIMVFAITLLGVVIYLPFWRAYEKANETENEE